MSFCEELILNIIILLFPIFIYLLYVAYSNNINKKKNEYIYDILLITNVYLLIKYRICFSNVSLLLLINVPLILSFVKKRYKCATILSIIIAVYYTKIYDMNFLLIIIEYIFYYLLFICIIWKKKTMECLIYLFIFFKGIILSFEIFYIIPKETNFINSVFQVFLILLVFYVVLILSIYLLKKGEQILSLNKALKELEHEKELRNSLFKITHEIKNPIAVCKGYLDMINFDNIEKLKSYTKIMKSEINRTLIIMDEFLDYTKVKVNLSEMDIVMLLEETISSIMTLLSSKNIKLNAKIPDDEIYINGDYNKLKQVFINVIKNSIEAIHHDEGIIQIELKEDKKKIYITFEDNGEGMDKETLQKINEMFFTTKEKGTGLGIPLSNEIINLHNGKIKYESTKGKKTKVTIYLHKKYENFK